MSDRPESPADPRPNNEPFFIDSCCKECGVELVLLAEFDDDVDLEEETGEEGKSIYHDEWVCPNTGCEMNDVYWDVPESFAEEIISRADDEDESVELESVKLDDVQ